MPIRYYTHGRRDQMKVALTFDDGPNPPRTDQVIEILNSRGRLPAPDDKALPQAPAGDESKRQPRNSGAARMPDIQCDRT